MNVEKTMNEEEKKSLDLLEEFESRIVKLWQHLSSATCTLNIAKDLAVKMGYRRIPLFSALEEKIQKELNYDFTLSEIERSLKSISTIAQGINQCHESVLVQLTELVKPHKKNDFL